MIAIVDYCGANVPASLKGINMASFGLLTCRSVSEINHWGALKCHSISVRTKHVNLQLPVGTPGERSYQAGPGD